MCKGSQTTTTSSAPSPQAMAALNSVIGGASNVATNNPYVPYTGEIVAGQTPQQTALNTDLFNDNQIATPYYYQGSGDIQTGVGAATSGLGALDTAKGIVAQGVGSLGNATNSYGTAANYTQAGAGAVDPMAFSKNAVDQYYSPYQSDVIQATERQLNQQDAVQGNQLLGQAIAAGNAFGGDRAGVAQAQLGENQDIVNNATIANLENQGYAQALGEFNTQQRVDLAAQQANKARLLQAGAQFGQIGAGQTGVGTAAGNLANVSTGIGTAAGTLGTEIGNLGTSEAGLGQSLQTGQINAQTAALSAQQQAQATKQAQDTAAYQQYQLGEAFPYAQESWLAGIDTGAAGAMGGTSATTGPPPSLANSIIGGGATLGAAALLAAKRGGRINAPKGLGREHLAAGGVPLFGGVPWLNPSTISSGRGVGIPSPPSLPQQAAAANFGPASGLLTKGLQNNGSGGTPGSVIPGDIGPSSYGGPAGPSPLVDTSVNSANAAFSQIYAGGGGVLGLKENPTTAQLMAQLGEASPSEDADYANVNDNPTPGFAFGGMPIQLRPAPSLPRRMGGLGLGSSLMGRRGFADGGGQDDDAPLSSRLDAATEAIADGTFDPVGKDYTAFAPPLIKDDRKIAGLGEIPLPRARPAGLVSEIAANTDSLPADDPNAPPFRLDGTAFPPGTPPITPERAAAHYAGIDSPDESELPAAPIRGLGRTPLPPQILNPDGASPSLPPGVMAYGPGANRGIGPTNSPVSLAPTGLGMAPGVAGGAPAGLGAAPLQATGQPSPGVLDRLRSMSPEAKLALLTFGLQTMASRSPFPAVAVGEGGLAAVNSYTASQKANQEAADKAKAQAVEQERLGMEHQRVGFEATRLQQAADAAKLAEQTAPLIKDKNGNIVPNQAQLDLLKAQHEITDRDNLAPTNRTTPDGRMIYYNKQTGKEQVGDIVGEGKESWKPYPYLTPDGHPTVYNANGQIKDTVTQAIVPPNTPLKSAKSNAMSPDAIEVAAHQAAAGDLKSAFGNLGIGTAGAENKVAIRNRATELLVKEGGMTPAQAAAYMSAANQEYEATGTGLKAQARTAGVREANLNIILKATDAAIPAAIEASRAVSRTGWVPLNQILQKGEVIASNPELKEFGMANLQLAEHWARAMNPTGVMRESDRDKALSFLSTADSPETYERAVLQLKKQIEREKAAVHSISDKGGFNAPVGNTTAETAKAEIDAVLKGKQPPQSNAAKPASLQEFISKAKAAGSTASDEALTAYYKKTYQ
jgi:hypothetical protein